MDLPQDTKLTATCAMVGLPQGEMGMEGIRMRQDMTLDTAAATETGIDMVTGLELGETAAPVADAPSLILRRAGQESLWDMAKRYGSTEDAIRSANNLADEPLPSQILIIPI